MDDALTIATRFSSDPIVIRDLELSILRHMEHHMRKANNQALQAAAAIADRHATETGSSIAGGQAIIIATEIRKLLPQD